MESLLKKNKIAIVFIYTLFSCFVGYSQVGINVSRVDPSAVFEIESTTKGILIPRMSAVERITIAIPADGLMVYDNDSSAFFYYNGTRWRPIGDAADNDWKMTSTHLFPMGDSTFTIGPEQVTIGGIYAHSSAILEIRDSTRGVLFPRMTLGQRLLIQNPDTSLILYQTNGYLNFKEGFYYYNGSTWISMSQGNVWLRVLDTMLTVDTAVIIRDKKMGMGVFNIDSSAIMELKSTTQGFLMTRLTKNQRNAMTLADLEKGLLLYQIDDDSSGIYFVDGSGEWNAFNKHEETWIKDADTIYAWKDSAITVRNQQVGLGAKYPDTTAVLHIQSTTKGILLPRMTTTQKTAIPNPEEGLLLYDSTKRNFSYFNGKIWKDIPNSAEQIKLTAEYSQTVINPDGTNNMGRITTDTVTIINNIMPYYQWLSDNEQINDCDIYTSILIPESFSDLKDNNTFTLKYQTQTTNATEGSISVYIYLEGISTPIAQKLQQTSVNWTDIIFNKADFTKVLNPLDKIVIVIKLNASRGLYTRTGDMILNYKSN